MVAAASSLPAGAALVLDNADQIGRMCPQGVPSITTAVVCAITRPRRLNTWPLGEPHHEHGNLGPPQHRFRDRAEQEPAEPAPAVRRHGDEVSPGFPRRSHELRHRLPVPNVGRHPHATLAQIGGHGSEVLASLLQPGRHVIDHEVAGALDGLRHDRLHDADQYHLQIKRARDLEDEGEDPLRQGRAVERNQHPLIHWPSPAHECSPARRRSPPACRRSGSRRSASVCPAARIRPPTRQ